MANEPNQPVEQAPQPIPVPPEVIAAALRDFNEAEVIEEIREIRNGGGRKLEDFLPELEKAASVSANAPQV